MVQRGHYNLFSVDFRGITWYNRGDVHSSSPPEDCQTYDCLEDEDATIAGAS